jgi:hypothetical protein
MKHPRAHDEAQLIATLIEKHPHKFDWALTDGRPDPDRKSQWNSA